MSKIIASEQYHQLVNYDFLAPYFNDETPLWDVLNVIFNKQNFQENSAISVFKIDDHRFSVRFSPMWMDISNSHLKVQFLKSISEDCTQSLLLQMLNDPKLSDEECKYRIQQLFQNTSAAKLRTNLKNFSSSDYHLVNVDFALDIEEANGTFKTCLITAISQNDRDTTINLYHNLNPDLETDTKVLFQSPTVDYSYKQIETIFVACDLLNQQHLGMIKDANLHFVRQSLVSLAQTFQPNLPKTKMVDEQGQNINGEVLVKPDSNLLYSLLEFKTHLANKSQAELQQIYNQLEALKQNYKVDTQNWNDKQRSNQPQSNISDDFINHVNK